jgi:hypothetical protein
MNYPNIEKEFIENYSRFETYSERRLYLETLAKTESGNIIKKEIIRDYLHKWYISMGHRIFECTVEISKKGAFIFSGKCFVVEEPTCLTIEPVYKKSIFEINRNNILEHCKFSGIFKV